MDSQLLSSAVAVSLAGILLRMGVILLFSLAALRLLNRTTERVRQNWLRASTRFARRSVRNAQASTTTQREELEKRSRTIAEISRQVLSFLVLAVAGLGFADEAGFDIRAMLGAVGILSLAVGFGARSLVQDIVNGIFLLMENQIREGDVVRVRDTTGTVEAITLRYLRLRGADGIVHIFPNGTIGVVSNLSYQFAFFVWDLKLSYHADVDLVAATLQELGRELRQDPDHDDSILDDLEIMGIDAFHPHGPVLKMRFKTRPHRRWAVGRAFSRLVKQRFDELGIPLPLASRRLYPGDSRSGSTEDREHLKQEVRTLLASGSLPLH